MKNEIVVPANRKFENGISSGSCKPNDLVNNFIGRHARLQKIRKIRAKCNGNYDF